MSFNVNSYKEFLSWNNNKVSPPENPYQIDLAFQEYIVKIDYTKLKPDQIYLTRMIKEFKDEYIKKLISLSTPTEIKKFFNYHFIKYKGIKEDFIYFVEWTISDLKAIYFNQQMSHFEDYIYQIIKDWAMEKRSEQKIKIVEPKLRDYCSHPQQIILFEKLGIIKYLQTKYKLSPAKLSKAISYLSNRGLDNTKSYIRYVSQTKGQTTSSKQNLNPNTPNNIEFINQIIKELGLS